MDQISISSTQFQAATTPTLDYVADGQGLHLWVFGVLLTMKALGNETGGTYSIHENLVFPGQGPPLHIHTLEEEMCYILDGELQITVADKEFIAKKGSFVHLPRFVPHKFLNKLDKPSRMLVTYAPAGFEEFFLETGTPVLDPTEMAPEPTKEQIEKTFSLEKKYGLTWILPAGGEVKDE